MSKVAGPSATYSNAGGLEAMQEERIMKRMVFNGIKEQYKQTYGEAKNAPDYEAEKKLQEMFSVSLLAAECDYDTGQWMRRYPSQGAFHQVLTQTEGLMGGAENEPAAMDLSLSEKTEVFKDRLPILPQKRRVQEFYVGHYLFMDMDGCANSYIDTRSSSSPHLSQPVAYYDPDVILQPSAKKPKLSVPVAPTRRRPKMASTSLPMPVYSAPQPIQSLAPPDGAFADVWSAIVRHDTSVAAKNMSHSRSYLRGVAAHAAASCQALAEQTAKKSVKTSDNHVTRAKKLSKDVQSFWKKFSKAKRGAKVRANKQATDQRKKEDEAREAQRQQKKLDFLLTQTELYAHFIGKKDAPAPAVSEAQSAEDVATLSDANKATEKAIEATRLRTEKFDAEMRKKKEVAKGAQAKLAELAEPQPGEESVANATNGVADGSGAPAAPSGSAVGTDEDVVMETAEEITGDKDMLVTQPRMFVGKLKIYQLKGLNWLVNLYEQGLNGILADDMGLGKTIQTISFLAHLAEEKDIWGPFMVIAPLSTLHNWQKEITRFAPNLRAIPYWGTTADRKVIRQLWTPKNMYTRNARFHVLVTSYQLVVQDEQYFRRVKWQYMVLDEAHALKSTRSLRWKTLLGFNCRNRLLLTGTPIQNNMAELWALLHFIMPSFFDSHDEFNEWFSKDIEQHAEGTGDALNEQQLSRLHTILKPFMLRRIKTEVINELSEKEEIEVKCHLSQRQRRFYDAIKSRISISDLLQNSTEVLHLMNLVMQFRKVCNHPELFERRGVLAPYQLIASAPYRHSDDQDNTVNKNPLAFSWPRLLADLTEKLRLEEVTAKFSVFDAERVAASVAAGGLSAFSFTRFCDLSPGEASWLAKGDALDRLGAEEARQERLLCAQVAKVTGRSGGILDRSLFLVQDTCHGLSPSAQAISPLLASMTRVGELEHNEELLRAVKSTYSYRPAVCTTPIRLEYIGRRETSQRVEEMHSVRAKQWLLGTEHKSTGLAADRSLYDSQPSPFGVVAEPKTTKALAVMGEIGSTFISVPSFGNLLRDSGKMQVLDSLLQKLKGENADHRVLVYSQMTKMIDLLEDYMIFRGHKYHRLDGQSKLSERRDMVNDFQTNPDAFVFLLSTRAGGLGINLTAADTVIFYDSDWNPTMDAQAMDRAHRLGQTRKVTVYRLVCEGTVEERILKRAQQKHMLTHVYQIQSIVIAGGKFQTDGFRDSQEVVSLLLNDAEVDSNLIKEVEDRRTIRRKGRKGRAGFAV